jgi:hypothetical protein
MTYRRIIENKELRNQNEEKFKTSCCPIESITYNRVVENKGLINTAGTLKKIPYSE